MQKDVQERCPYCGSENVVGADADWHRKSKEPLLQFLFALGFVMVLFVCIAIAKMGYYPIAVLLFTFMAVGFVAQYFIRDYLDKRMVITYFCQECQQSWSK